MFSTEDRIWSYSSSYKWSFELGIIYLTKKWAIIWAMFKSICSNGNEVPVHHRSPSWSITETKFSLAWCDQVPSSWGLACWKTIAGVLNNMDTGGEVRRFACVFSQPYGQLAHIILFEERYREWSGSILMPIQIPDFTFFLSGVNQERRFPVIFEMSRMKTDGQQLRKYIASFHRFLKFHNQ